VNILFVCSRNKWRSRTAEDIFKNSQRHNVKSAGTENSARIRVSEKLITWADLIFVMEKKHKQRLKEKFSTTMDSKEIIILDIPDDYEYMEPELIEILKNSVSAYFDN
jgi:predicted protein tyrosine phosphatase